MTAPNRRFKQLLTAPFVIIASFLLWCEETLWDWLKWLTAAIAQLRLVHWIEAAILRLPPYATMAVFLLPTTLLFPVKLLAVYWLSRGYWLASVTMLISAKVLGTALVARIYVICKPKLLTIHWFRWFHDLVFDIHNRLFKALHSLPFYQAVRATLIAIKQAVIAMRNHIKISEWLRVFWGWFGLK